MYPNVSEPVKRQSNSIFCVLVFPIALAAQSIAPSTAAPSSPPASRSNSRDFPVPNLVKGQPIESRAPEKSDAKPDLPRKQQANEGGRIAIGRDGNQFVTIGDRSTSPPWDLAQKLDNDLGKIIHITPDGTPAAGHPFIGKPSALPEIWPYGHRSEEGLTINPETGELWETEHEPRGGDELNTPEAGKNYGWPGIVHGIDYPGDTIGEGTRGHGAAALLLGPGDRSIGLNFLHWQFISAVEKQGLRGSAPRSDA